MSNDKRIWTVSELNREIRLLLDRSLQQLWISGETTDVKIHDSGHVYFRVKDNKSQLSAVFFKGADIARRLGLANGMQVEINGKIRVYEQQGQYQIYVEEIRPAGVGLLQQKFLELKQKLEAEGLFDPARKKPIPVLPSCIGIITSATGAALRDFLNVVDRRFPNVHIRIVDARMQGAESAIQVIRAIRYLNRQQACDVIVVTRGGGSIEDMWCFNDENLVRHIAASEIPLISAIGHEIDFTLCDFVADLRAPTPSAAAELVVGRKAEYAKALEHLNSRLVHAVNIFQGNQRSRVERAVHGLDIAVSRYLADAARRVEYCKQHYLMRQPELMLQPYRQRLADSMVRLEDAVDDHLEGQSRRVEDLRRQLSLVAPHRQAARQRERLTHIYDRLCAAALRQIERRGERLARARLQLQTLGPERTLARGYSILIDDKGVAVKDASRLHPGDEVSATLHQGKLGLAVKTVQNPLS